MKIRLKINLYFGCKNSDGPGMGIDLNNGASAKIRKIPEN